MKLLFYILALLVPSMLLAQDTPAVHGMAVMGQHQIYASHLASFRSPHDYQVILEIELAPKAKDIYLEAYQNSKTKFFTIKPDSFVLMKAIRSNKAFKAQLYEGYFDREGSQNLGQVEVKVKKVLYSKKLNEKKGLKTLNFILFGNEKEQFAAHLITVAPDFDQVFQVRFPIGELPKMPCWEVVVPDIPNAAFKKEWTKVTYKAQKSFEVEAFKEIFLERDKLE